MAEANPEEWKWAKKVEKSSSVSEVADLLSVSRTRVYKWLSLGEPEGAVIPLEAWFKLPGSGHIRIREWIVLELQEQVR